MSLKDAIASLFDPAPAQEVDPEDVGLEDEPFSGPEIMDLHTDKQPSRSAAERARLRADIHMEGEAYRGKKSSRAAVFGDDEQVDDDGDDALDGQLSGDHLLGSDDQCDDSEEQGGGDDQERQQQAGSEEDSEADEAEVAARAALQAQVAAATAQHSSELAALEAEAAEAEAQDAAALAAMRQHSEKERAKSRAVRHQRTLWEHSLELRILLQKPLAGGNRMPCPAVQQAVLAQDQGLQQQYSQLHTAAAETLQLLLQMQSALVDNNPAIAAAAGQQEQQQQQGSKAGSKRSRQAFASGPACCSAMWSQVEAGQARCAAFCEQALDKWHRRAVLSSGSAVLRNSLRALNQSISSQVAAVMKDPSRFIERSQLEVSSSSRPLCHRQQEQQQQQEQAPGGSSAAGPGSAAREPDTYDDSEFYQLLLKELLEAGSGAGRPAPVRAAKKRKQVDRRASKGRKVRYHVHDKLVGFMTAGDHEAPPFAEQLFANLFGYSGSSAA